MIIIPHSLIVGMEAGTSVIVMLYSLPIAQPRPSSVAIIVNVHVPTVVGVPEITILPELMVSPSGSMPSSS